MTAESLPAAKPSNQTDHALVALEALGQGVLLFDSEYRLQYANASAGKTLRRFAPRLADRDETLGLPIDDLFPVAEFCGWVRQIAQAWSGEMQANLRLCARVGDQQAVFDADARSMQSEDGATFHVLTLHEITDRQTATHQLAGIQATIAEGVIASHVSHDLNNFLSLVMGGIQLTQMALKKGNTEKADASLDKLLNNTRKIEAFSNELSGLSNNEAAKDDLDLNNLVRCHAAFMAGHSKYCNIDIETDLDPALPLLSADYSQLSQLLLNLLENAADAIGESGRDDGRVCISSKLDDSVIVLSVADNGAGMESGTTEKLFRAHFTTKPNGYGYALVNCARIIVNHFAEFDVISAPGEGTTITFRFPLEPPPRD